MTHRATKVVIITEKVILAGVADVIERCGGSGYTVVAAGGKGSRGVRQTGRPGVSEAFANVKIEVITASDAIAHAIAETVAETYFDDYAGVTYLEAVEILRPHKFV